MSANETFGIRSALLQEIERLCQEEKNTIIKNHSSDIKELANRLQFLVYKKTILENQALMENSKLLESHENELIKKYKQNFEEHAVLMNIRYQDFDHRNIFQLQKKLYRRPNIAYGD
jgi:hypothetical protein